MPWAKGSWYSQLPEYGWRDTGDKPGSNALGVPDEEQGIALPSRKTLGQWFDVKGPDGNVHRVQQTDVGPAGWTGRGIDISAAAAHKMGYTPKTFPTDAKFEWQPASGDAPETGAIAQGKTPMADDNAGLLTRLGYQPQEQMGGILGGMGGGGFESKLPYLAMIAKGLSPYSDIDPQGLMKLAQAQQERAIMNQYRQQQMDISRAAEGRHQAEFGFRQDEQLQRQDERRQKLQQEQEARQAETTIFDDASQSGEGLTRQQIYDYRKTHPNLTPRTEKMFNDRLAKLDAIDEKRGESDRDWNDRAQRAKKLGLEENTPEWQKFMANNKLSDDEKAIPGELAGRIGIANTYLAGADKLREDIEKGGATGLFDAAMGKAGLGDQGILHRQISSGVDALRRMLTGAGMNISEADAYLERYQPTFRDTATSLLDKHDRLVRELTEQRRLVMRGRGKDPGAPQSPAEKGSVEKPKYQDGQTATGPGGKKMIYREGQGWRPL